MGGRSYLCTPGWTGIVVIGDTALATAPNHGTGRAEQALGGLSAAPLTGVAHAIGAGWLPQWRARVQESRHIARALGFRELGTQVSIRLPGEYRS